MYSVNDLQNLRVYNLKGKYIGSVWDLALSFKENKVIGLYIKSNGMKNKKVMACIEDILAIGDSIIVNKVVDVEGVLFREIKFKEVVDDRNFILGIIEDIYIDEIEFNILGVVISTGIIRNFIEGKRIVLPYEIIIGEEQCVYRPKVDMVFIRKGGEFNDCITMDRKEKGNI